MRQRSNLGVASPGSSWSFQPPVSVVGTIDDVLSKVGAEVGLETVRPGGRTLRLQLSGWGIQSTT